MWPVRVVVVDVDAQDALEVPAANDQEPIEAVPADRADPAFGERVRLRRPERSADDLNAFALEDGVERAAEFAVAVVDQETRRSLRVFLCIGGWLGVVGYAVSEVDA